MGDGRSQPSRLGRLQLVGAFAFRDLQGRDLTPKGQKARALLALVALSPGGKRYRTWLCDKLWSESAPPQAFASLRQALAEIRRAGGLWPELLQIDRASVGLCLDRIEVDIVQLRKRVAEGRATEIDLQAADAELLEGLDVQDPEFEEWLTVERSRWEDIREEIVNARRQPPRSAAQPIPYDNRSSSLAGRWRPALIVAPPAVPQGDGAAEALGGLTANLLVEAAQLDREVDILDYRSSEARSILGTSNPQRPQACGCIAVKVTALSPGHLIELTLVASDSAKVLWHGSLTVGEAAVDVEFTPLLCLVTQALERSYLLLLRLADRQANDPRHATRQLLNTAADELFSFGRPQLANAERRLDAAIALQPSAEILSWRAFAATFRVGQKVGSGPQVDLAAVNGLVRRALELDASSATVLTLCGYTISYLFHDHERAGEILARSLRLAPRKALSWDLFSIVQAYSGDPAGGLKSATWAEQIGRGSANAFYYEVSCCINASLAGQHATAVRFGRQALSLRPEFNPILRYMLSSLGHLGEKRQAAALLEQLRRLEPDFSIETYLAGKYPPLPSALRESYLAGLAKAGVRRRSG